VDKYYNPLGTEGIYKKYTVYLIDEKNKNLQNKKNLKKNLIEKV
jgi:hypothetical protein